MVPLVFNNLWTATYFPGPNSLAVTQPFLSPNERFEFILGSGDAGLILRFFLVDPLNVMGNTWSCYSTTIWFGVHNLVVCLPGM